MIVSDNGGVHLACRLRLAKEHRIDWHYIMREADAERLRRELQWQDEDEFAQ